MSEGASRFCFIIGAYMSAILDSKSITGPDGQGTLRSPWHSLLLFLTLFLALLLTYGVFAPSLGFYWDDWWTVGLMAQFGTGAVRVILDVGDCDALVGDTVNIAYGRPRTVAEVAAAVLKTAGRTDLEPVQERPRPGDVHLHYADTTKAQKMIGWCPMIALEEGIARLLEHLKRTGADFRKMLSEQSTFNWE
jgi:hypothetical protein